ncbi:HD-GYP domain-containing protein [Lichenicoccus sp.]|uniref:HD-GYP domain-containing protein n=1 Tax=Lichenicoccus sp. TaxID=2781899 RepID=UPI003D117F7B
MTQPKSILLVTADPERMPSLRRSLALLQPVRTLCLAEPLSLDGVGQDEAAGHAMVPDGDIAAIVSLVAPRGEGRIRQLRSAFEPFRLQHTPILCLIAAPTQRDEVQARALGAAAVLGADSSCRDLAAALRPWLRDAGGSSNTGATSAAAADVGLAIADMLAAAMQGSCITMQAVVEASDIMLEAIAEDGIHAWLRLVSNVDDRTYRHCMTVSGLVAAFALALGFSHTDCDRLTRAALMHDIGKGTIALEILNKAAPLDAQELAIMRGHASVGHDLLVAQGAHDAQHEAMTLDVVRHHHETLDGMGYPDGLAGGAISDPVRIVAICDVFTTLIGCRPSQSGLAGHDAFRIMQEMQGKLDTHLLALFSRVFDRAPPWPPP